MRGLRIAFSLVLALLLPEAGSGDTLRGEAAGSPNAAYLESVRGRGLHTEIDYLDPSAPLPPIDGVALPRPDDRSGASALRRDWALFMGILLLVLLVLVGRYGRGITVTLGPAARDARRVAPADSPACPPVATEPEAFLRLIEATPDRRSALILLMSRTLERAAEINNQRLARAQTAREALRALPQHWPHIAALRGLVAEAEIVRFGGHTLSEERWRVCVESARPILIGRVIEQGGA